MSNWPKLKRDWTGLRVRLKRNMETQGGVIFKAGEIMEIDGYYRGMELKAIYECPHCNRGYRQVIKRISQHEVELVESAVTQ